MTKVSARELTKQIDDCIKQLAEETDKAKVSKTMVEYLDFCSKFHNYSPSNQWLIYLQRPDATHVAGFETWKKMGRYASGKGTGIRILAPHWYDKEDNKGNTDTKIGFHITYVYDVSNTEGEPLPEPPDWKSPEKNEQLTQCLMGFCEENNIEVVIEELEGECQGVSHGGKISLSPDAGTKTFIHELAHEMMHKGQERISLSKSIIELEAESVGYVVSKHFGINDLESPNYIALHGSSSKELMQHMDRVRQVASLIITYVEKKEPEKELA